MLITVQLEKGRNFPLVAPLGAAAYFVDSKDNISRVVFAMMKPGETGLDTLNRTLDTISNYDWTPVAARPEEQTAFAPDSDAFVAYEFSRDEYGTWSATSNDLIEFLEILQNIKSMPVKAPKSLGVILSGPKKPAAAK